MTVRLYRVHVVRKGRHTVLSPKPMTHKEALVFRSKLSDASRRYGRLVEVGEEPPCSHGPEAKRGRGPSEYCLTCLAWVEAHEEERERRSTANQLADRNIGRPD